MRGLAPAAQQGRLAAPRMAAARPLGMRPIRAGSQAPRLGAVLRARQARSQVNNAWAAKCVLRSWHARTAPYLQLVAR